MTEASATASQQTRWLRPTALVLGLAMLLSLVVASPAAASGATFTLDSWTRDADDETLASYETTLTVPTGVGCGQTYSTRCEFVLTAYYADEYVDRSQGRLVWTSALANDSGPSVYEFDYVDRSLAPVTYLRAVLHPIDGSPDTVWEIPVGDTFVYPEPDPSAELVQFVRDPDDETLADFRFDLDFLGMGSPGAPCWNHDTTIRKCRYTIRLEHRSVHGTKGQYSYAGAVYADDDLGQISPTATHQLTTTVGPVTHAVVKIYGDLTGPGSAEDPYTWEIVVADPLAAVEHTQATAGEIEAGMGVEEGDIPDEAVQALVTALAVQDDAEIILALQGCPSTNSSLNECQKAFAAARAAGATKTTALARVLRLAGGAALAALGIGLVTHEAFNDTPPGEFPPPDDVGTLQPPPEQTPTFDPYQDPAASAWVGTPEFYAAADESVQVAEGVEVTVVDQVRRACQDIANGSEPATADVHNACLRLNGSLHVVDMRDVMIVLMGGAYDWDHGTGIVDDILVVAAPPVDVQEGYERDPLAFVTKAWAPSYEHVLDLPGCGMTDGEFADMVEIAQASNQFIRDNGGSATLHRTSVTVDGKRRQTPLGRESAMERGRWARAYVDVFGPIPEGKQVSHMGDSTLTGLARTDIGGDGFELHWAEANRRVGSYLGGRHNGSGIVTVFTVDGQFVGTLDNPLEPERLC